MRTFCQVYLWKFHAVLCCIQNIMMYLLDKCFVVYIVFVCAVAVACSCCECGIYAQVDISNRFEVVQHPRPELNLVSNGGIVANVPGKGHFLIFCGRIIINHVTISLNMLAAKC